MPGETELHKTLKKEACRWLYRHGYRCVAAEVRLRSLGIIDAVGTGIFSRHSNFPGLNREVPQVCFIECKASRSDFLRDLSEDGQMSLCLMERRANPARSRRRSRNRLRQIVGLGKFASCLLQPMANLHFVLAPAGVLQKKDVPARWGLLTMGDAGISCVVKPTWQEHASVEFVESAIARTLTDDIYRADDRALSSVNRDIMNQQMHLAERIRALRPVLPTDLPQPTAPMFDAQADAKPV
jgi:hypothetical protein